MQITHQNQLSEFGEFSCIAHADLSLVGDWVRGS
jgi:hypothetical protein